MQRIVTYTRIHGNGDELVINEMLKAEFKRQREKERKYITMLEEKHTKNLRQKMDILRAMVCPRCDRSKGRDTFEFVMACLYGWAEKARLVEYIHNIQEWKKEWKRK